MEVGDNSNPHGAIKKVEYDSKVDMENKENMDKTNNIDDMDNLNDIDKDNKIKPNTSLEDSDLMAKLDKEADKVGDNINNEEFKIYSKYDDLTEEDLKRMIKEKK